MAALGKAYIEVRADLAAFPAELREKLKLAMAEATTGIHFTETDHAMHEAGERAGEAFDRGLEEEIDKGKAEQAGKRAAGHFWKGLGGAWRGLAAAFLPVLIAWAVEIGAYLLPAVGALAGAIPAAAAVAVGALAPVIAAFHGVGSAIAGALSGQATAAQLQAMQNLTPAAKQFVLQLYDARAQLKGLQTDAQQAFFGALNPGLRQALTLLPLVRQYFGQFAGDMGTFARNVLTAFAADRSGIESVLLGIHAVLSDLAPLGTSLTRIFVDLAAVGLPFLDTLTRGFVGMVGRFQQFIAAASASGALSNFFDTALTILRALGSTLGSIFRLIGDIVGALSEVGGQGLSVLKDVVDQLDAFFRTAEGHQTLVALFTLLNTALDSLGKILGPLLPALGTLVTDLANGLTGALLGLTPLLQKTAEFLGKHPDLVKAAVIAWAAYRTALIMVAIAEAIVDALDPATWIVLLVAAIIAAVVLIVVYWDKIKNAALAAWHAIVDAGKAAWKWLQDAAKAVGDWFGDVVGWFEALPGKILGFILGLPGQVESIFSDLSQRVMYWVGYALGWVLGEFIRLPGEIWDALVALPGQVAQVWLDVWHWSVAHLEALGKWLSDFFSALPGKVWGWLVSLPGKIVDLWTQVHTWTMTKLDALGKSIGQFFLGLPGTLGHLLYSAGKAIGNFIIDGINSAIHGINKGLKAAGVGDLFSIPDIPHLAKGGLITSPTVAMVGEAGPEVVLPLNNPARTREIADQAGVTQLLVQGLQQANVQLTVLAMLDSGDFIRVIDTRVTKGLDKEAQLITTGSGHTGGL